MFICSIDGSPTESKTHEQDEDSYQRVFSICPVAFVKNEVGW